MDDAEDGGCKGEADGDANRSQTDPEPVSNLTESGLSAGVAANLRSVAENAGVRHWESGEEASWTASNWQKSPQAAEIRS